MRHLLQLIILSCACLLATPVLAQAWSTIDTIVRASGQTTNSGAQRATR